MKNHNRDSTERKEKKEKSYWLIEIFKNKDFIYLKIKMTKKVNKLIYIINNNV